MEIISSHQMKLPQPVRSFGSCVSCGLTLCSTTSPQLLPCLHSVCKDCVSLMGDIKECPICQEKVELKDIISNLLFDELSANLKGPAKCQSCEDCAVTDWCVQCHKNFCTGCVIAHKRVKLAHKHTVHTITPECPRPVVCPVHKKELIYSYCLTCDRLICKLCQPLHPKHLLQYVHEAVGKQRKQIQRMVQKAQQQRLTVQKNITDLDMRLSDLEELQSQVRLEVKETVVRLCNVMVKKAAKLNKEIKVLCGKEKEKLAERRSLLQKLKEKLDHVLTFTDKTLASQQHTVLLSCKRQIHDQLQGMLDQVVSPTSTVMDLSFHTNETHVKKVLKIFGCVVAREVPFACSSTGNVAKPPADLLALNCSRRVPTAAFQNPTNTNATSHSSSPSASVLQQSPPSPKQHPVPSSLLSKKIPNHSTRDGFSSSQNNKYSNYPGLKRAWSYHPYYPKEALQPVKCSVKSISPLTRRKERVPSSKANPPKLASSFPCTSAPVSSVSVQQTFSAPIFTGCNSALLSHSQKSKSHENNLDFIKPSRQQSTTLSSPAKVVPSAALRRMLSDGQKNKNRVEHTFTVTDTQLDQKEDRPTSLHTTVVGAKPKEPSFQHCELSKGFRSDLQTNKLVRNGPASATVAAVGSCSAERQALTPENGSISRRVKGYQCNQSEVGSKSSKKRSQPSTLEHEEESTEHTIINTKVKLNGLTTMQTATQTNPLVIDKTEPVEKSLALANVKDSYTVTSTLQEEDDKDEKTFTMIRDDQGNLAALETLGSNWLPNVLVTRLPLPDFSSYSPTPVLWEEESRNFQLCAIKEDDEFPALAPITSNASRPLVVNKLHCTACRIKGALFQCSVCRRAFHKECHLPPVSVNSGEHWQCTLCSDLSHSEDLDLSGSSSGLNVNDQRKCEHLLLYLSCNRHSSLLYRPVKLSPQTSRYVDMTLIRGRLLKKLTPHYLTPGEFVSDVWLLLHTLLNSSKDPQPVMRLQRFFSKELMKVFGRSLHPSLLKDPFTEQQEEKGNRETDV